MKNVARSVINGASYREKKRRSVKNVVTSAINGASYREKKRRSMKNVVLRRECVSV